MFNRQYISSEKNTIIIITLLIISAFGPYLSNRGIRTEHVVIYFLMPLACLILLKRKKTFLNYKYIFGIFTTSLLILIWVLTVTFLTGQYESTYKLIADIENYLQPIAVMIIVAAFVNNFSVANLCKLLNRASYILFVLLSLNTILAILSSFIDIYNYLYIFYGDFELTGSVAYNSMQMGRYNAVFNQPFESGVTYSMGIILWVYQIAKKTKPTTFDYILIVLLLVGGSLSVSKVFLLGGIPLGLIFLIITKRLRIFYNWVGLAALIPLFVVAWSFITQWSGYNYMTRLFNFESANMNFNDYLYLFTAGRFGGETTVKTIWSYVASVSPFYGLGFASITGAIDNGYLLYFAQGGIVGLLLFALSLFIIARLSLRNYASVEGKLLIIILILIIGASVGAPVYTINRFSTILWTILPIICCINIIQMSEKRSVNQP
jgi:hypothetical protein